MNNTAIANANRKLRPAEIAQRINNALSNKGITDINIAATMALPGSGDIKVTAATNEEAVKLRNNSGWTVALGPEATIKTRSYSVFLKGVSTESIIMTDMEVLKKSIKEENKHTLEMDIQWTGFLHKLKEGERRAPLIIEMKTEVQADTAIRKGINIGAEWYRCEVYNRQARSIQCFKCWLYGHVSTSCFNQEKCGYCASSEHNHRLCPSKGVTILCTACGGNHYAWSKECPKKKGDIERIKIAKANTPHFHGTTQLFTPGRGEGVQDNTTDQNARKRQPEVDSEGFVTPYPPRPSSDRAGPSISCRGRGGSNLVTRGGITSGRRSLLTTKLRDSSPTKRTRSRSPTKTPTEPGATTRSRSRGPLSQLDVNRFPLLPPASRMGGSGSKQQTIDRDQGDEGMDRMPANDKNIGPNASGEC